MSGAWYSSIPTQLNKKIGIIYEFFNTESLSNSQANLPWYHSSHESHWIINCDGSYVCLQMQYKGSAMFFRFDTIWRHQRRGLWQEKASCWDCKYRRHVDFADFAKIKMLIEQRLKYHGEKASSRWNPKSIGDDLLEWSNGKVCKSLMKILASLGRKKKITYAQTANLVSSDR